MKQSICLVQGCYSGILDKILENKPNIKRYASEKKRKAQLAKILPYSLISPVLKHYRLYDGKDPYISIEGYLSIHGWERVTYKIKSFNKNPNDDEENKINYIIEVSYRKGTKVISIYYVSLFSCIVFNNILYY